MDNNLYSRIKKLCAKHNITITKLESELGFGSSSIKKWEKTSSPSVDKIMKVANYFDVSIDYLLGRSDIEGSISEHEKEKMMQMLRLGFEHAFSEREDG